MKPFFTKLSIYSILIAAMDYCWNNFMPPEDFIPKIWFILGFFIAITIVFHILITNAANGRPQNFIRFYMGSTALRMAICLIVIVVYRFADKPTVIPFALGFMVHYMLFTIFEVTSLLKLLRK